MFTGLGLNEPVWINRKSKGRWLFAEPHLKFQGSLFNKWLSHKLSTKLIISVSFLNLVGFKFNLIGCRHCITDEIVCIKYPLVVIYVTIRILTLSHVISFIAR